MCFFFIIYVSVTTFWICKSASIFKLSPVSDRKVNLFGTLWGQNVIYIQSNFPNILTFLELFINHSNFRFF
ncbi:hypothetical protein FWK35_00026429 [Aphis craccivora]|uniref:Uncharacterized protein n=1 Tax=Aphis craccivora TaxID=307492 RepID=A0A6G0XZQ9_APHCR|nr:hypothetical protein FWK35_00026429 [Aphis craccivora]